ncbi:hypothetical protein TNCV_3664311 [Trichonephila clavipes]|nr:hypothetical protein TNCV_3664311 [Trichonephila clavipes]
MEMTLKIPYFNILRELIISLSSFDVNPDFVIFLRNSFGFSFGSDNFYRCVLLESERHARVCNAHSVHVQMFRSSGQSDEKTPVFSSQACLVLIYRPTEGMKG